MLKPLNKHSKYIYILIFLFICFLLYFLFFKENNKKNELKRIDLDQKNHYNKFSFSSKSFSLRKDDSFLYFKKNNHTTTIKGFLVKKNNTKKRINSIKIAPNLRGKYYMNFYSFFSNPKENLFSFYLEQIRNNKIIRRRKFDNINSFKKHQLSWSLKKKDIIKFNIKGMAIGFISNPIFYPIMEKTAKHFVFIIVADTLAIDHIGIYNNKKKCTPNIDEFAKDSVTFNQAYTTSPWTLPAHMSLFTGRYPTSHQVNYGNEKLNKDIRILFEDLQSKFINYCINANGNISSLYGFARGFDFYNESYKDHSSRLASKELFKKAKELVLEEHYNHVLFLLHTYQIHTPYLPEAKLAKQYYNNTSYKFSFNMMGFIKNGKELFKKVTKKKREEIIKIYEAGIYTFDFRFGEFLKFLRQNKIYNKSTIILLSDHGEEFNEHGAWEHGHSLYNELIKIPLIVKFPENKYAEMKNNKIVSFVDILPTLMDLYNIKYRKNNPIDGISLLKTIKNIDKNKKRLIYSYLAPDALRKGIPEKIAIITDNIKYIYNKPMNNKQIEFFKTSPPEIKNEMFDIFKDPYDKNNILFKNRKIEKRLYKLIIKLKVKKGKKGHLKELEKQMKSLGYL